MPEIAVPIGYKLAPQVFKPIDPSSYFNRTLPTPPVPLVDSAAKAGAFGAMMKVLGELPGHLQQEYDAGKKRAVGAQVQKGFVQSLAGKPGARPLADFSATDDGKVTLKPEDPDVRAARIEALRRKGTPKPAAKSLWQKELEGLGGNPADIEAPIVEAPPGTDDGTPVEPELPADPGTASAAPTTPANPLAKGGDPAAAVLIPPMPTGGADTGGTGAEPTTALAPQLADFTPTPKGDNNARATAALRSPAPVRVMAALPVAAPTPGATESLGALDLPEMTGDPVPPPPAAVAAVPVRTAVPEERRLAIEGAASNIAGQLAGFSTGDDQDVSVSNAPGAAPARLQPVDEPVAVLTGKVEQAWKNAQAAEDAGDLTAAGKLADQAQELEKQLEELKAVPPLAPSARPSGVLPPEKPGERGPASPEPGAAAPAPGAAPVPGAPAVAPKSKKTLDRTTGIITLETGDGRKYQLLPHANSWKEVVDRSTQASALLKREAAQMGIDTDGKTNGQIAKLMEGAEKTQGVIRPSRLPVAQSLARLVVNHPALKHYPTIKEAKEAVDAGLENPDTGGFSDMALVEGFQRMINPGATVRAQTIGSMIDAAGWLQKLDPSYQWGKAVQGDKFSPEARQRIKKLADDIFDRATHNAMPQLNALKRIAKSYGITNPDDFVSNVMVMSPVLAASGDEVPTPYAVEPGVAPAPGAAPAPRAPAAPAGGVPTITTKAQYDALPSGASYRDSNGRLAKKK